MTERTHCSVFHKKVASFLGYAKFYDVLCLVHTCHKMAPLNGTILWRHKIARLA